MSRAGRPRTEGRRITRQQFDREWLDAMASLATKMAAEDARVAEQIRLAREGDKGAAIVLRELRRCRVWTEEEIEAEAVKRTSL